MGFGLRQLREEERACKELGLQRAGGLRHGRGLASAFPGLCPSAGVPVQDTTGERQQSHDFFMSSL